MTSLSLKKETFLISDLIGGLNRKIYLTKGPLYKGPLRKRAGGLQTTVGPGSLYFC